LEGEKTIKYFDIFNATVSNTASIGFVNLNVIPQGVGQSQRVGDTIWIDKIDVRLNCFVLEAGTDYTNVQRFGWFIWWQNNAAVAPNSTNVLQNAATWYVFSPYTYESREILSVLSEREFAQAGYTGIPTGTSSLYDTFTIFLKNHRVEFNVGLTTGTGTIYYFSLSDSGNIPHPQYTIHNRVWYYDAI